jgi:hypothetical protein
MNVEISRRSELKRMRIAIMILIMISIVSYVKNTRIIFIIVTKNVHSH